jgi:hypothetical protein
VFGGKRNCRGPECQQWYKYEETCMKGSNFGRDQTSAVFAFDFFDLVK